MNSAPASATTPLRLSYVYDTPVPSQLAAPIQIFNTCRALCEVGLPTTLYTGPLTVACEEAALAYYGLTPHPLLQIVPCKAGGRPRRQLLRELRQPPVAATPHVILSRGEQGVTLFHQLRRSPQNGTERHVYEAHRLCFTEVGRWQEPRQAERGGGVSLLAGLRRRWQAWRMWQRERRTVEMADGVICLTEGVEAALRAHFGLTAPTLILPSGTHLPAETLPPFADRDIDLLYIGKLKARKGIFDLVTALRHLPGRSLWLVGGTVAEQAAVRTHAQAQGVQAQLVLPGYVEPTQVAALYRRARVGVCPLPSGTSQIAERFTSPLKVLEMMAHGVPIVGTEVPALQAILAHDETALLVAPNSPVALAQGMGALLQDEQRAQRLARAARVAVQHYSWANRAARLYEFLHQIAAVEPPKLSAADAR